MDAHLMKVWLDDIWLEYIKKVSKDIGFENSLLTYDAFAAHKTDDVESVAFNILDSKANLTTGMYPFFGFLNLIILFVLFTLSHAIFYLPNLWKWYEVCSRW